MKKAATFLFTIFFSIQFLAAQEITVVSVKTGQPIPDVEIFNTNKNFFTTTNKQGKATLSGLSAEDRVIIDHQSYKSIELSVKTIASDGYKVAMEVKVVLIDDVFISANKWEQDKKEVPIRIEKITPELIEAQDPQTSADLLTATGKVFVQKSQLGGGSPMIRGFSANRVLLVVDGVRMNNAIYRSGNLQNVINIDVNSVETAEVIFGPGSVIYGSDAMGGVMDFHTISPNLSFQKKWKTSGNALARYSSANNEFTGHLDLNFGGEKWAFLTSVSYSDFDDLTMGSHFKNEYQRNEYVERIGGVDSVVRNPNPDKQLFSGFQQINLMQKIRFRPNEDYDFQYGFYFSTTSDIPRYDRLTERRNGTLRNAEWYYGPQRWMMHSLMVKFKKPTKAYDELRLTGAYQNYYESRNDRRFGSNDLRYRSELVNIASINADFEKKLNSIHTMYYGAEMLYNNIGSEGFQVDIVEGDTTDVSSRYPDGSDYMATAAYANYKYHREDIFTFLAGIRFNYIFVDADFDTTFFPLPFTNARISTGSVNGSLGFVIRPFEAPWQFNLNASTGFRAPNIDDVGKIFDSEPGSVVVPNDGLKPEYVYSVDVGVQGEIGERLKLEIGGFYSYLTNALIRANDQFNGFDSIVYDGELSQVQSIQNLDNAFVAGVEFAMGLEISELLKFTSTLSWATGEDSDGNPLRHVPPLFGSAHLLLEKDKFKADLYLLYSGGFDFEDLAPSEQVKPHIYAIDRNGNPYSPAWMTLNLKMRYSVTDFLTLNAGIENLLDRRYRTYSSGIVAPGRNFIVGLRASF